MNGYYQDLPDDELVRRFQNGDDQVAEVLYQRHVTQMLAMVRRRLGSVRNRGGYDSEGIVQSGFHSMFSVLRKGNFDSSRGGVGALLCRIVQCKCAVKLRRKNLILSFGPDGLRAVVEAALADAEDLLGHLEC